ncbi:MAG: PhoH family protein [Abditibacteriaceae bacterium]
MAEPIQKIVSLPTVDITRQVLGHQDTTRKLIEASLPVKLDLHDGELIVSGESEDVERTSNLLEQLVAVAEQSGRGGRSLSPADISRLIDQLKNGQDAPNLEKILSDTVVVSERGKIVGPRTAGQKRYVQAIREKEMVFCIGPAGTGKTYLAVAAAVAAFKAHEVSRIVLTRPAVEAGERLGFLPGDFEAKIDPYLKPLFDALYDLFDAEKTQKMIERRAIEVAPLAYMRGRTLNDAFIILDEAQNTTPMQMKMFLTRMGFGSRMIITGDVTQTDLPHQQESGLLAAERILGGIPAISFVHLGKTDIVRHNLVQKIVEAFENSSETK